MLNDFPTRIQQLDATTNANCYVIICHTDGKLIEKRMKVKIKKIK